MIEQPLPVRPLVLGQKTTTRNRVALPASWMRCGTSKGLFIDRRYLPSSINEWKPWLVAAMGSKGEDVKQLDGIGGATSTTSKIAVVSASARPGIEVEYTFAQVEVGKEAVDFTGNCGNIVSGVGPYAIEQGLVQAIPGQKQIDIRIFNTNTSSIIVETVQLDEDGYYQESGDYRIAGIANSGSEVKVAFLSPAGAMTGRLFPTGQHKDTIILPHSNSAVQATMIDAGNPFVLIDASTLPTKVTANMLQNPSLLPLAELEGIRRAASVMMGLASDLKQAARTKGTPKIALILNPSEAKDLFSHDPEKIGADIAVISLSMGKVHPTLQLTGAVAISSALSVDGTVPAKLARSCSQIEVLPRSSRNLKIAHQRGCIEIEVQSQRLPNGNIDIESCSVSRTARTLFEGWVMFRP